MGEASSGPSCAPRTQWSKPTDPAERSQFRAELAPLNSSGLRASIQLKDFEVVSTAPDRSDPNKAVVRVKGNVLVCLSGSVSGQALNLNTCEAQPITARGDASDE